MARLRAAAFAALALLAVPARASFFPSSPFSEKAAGTTAAPFLKNPPSAHADALGGAYSSVVEGSEALFWNPAGMAAQEESLKSDAVIGYDALLANSYLGSLGFSRPLPGWGVLGAGLLYGSQSSQQGYNAVGDPTSSFTPADLAASLGFASRIDWVRVGGAVKIIHSRVGDASGTTFAADLGAQFPGAVATAEGPIDLALAVANLGPAMSIASGSDPLPFRAQIGARWHITEVITAMLDNVMVSDQDAFSPALGMQARFPVGQDIFADGRLGYSVAHARGIDGLTGLAAGFGLEWAGLRLDYAWVPYGDLGMTNRVSLGFAW